MRRERLEKIQQKLEGDSGVYIPQNHGQKLKGGTAYFSWPLCQWIYTYTLNCYWHPVYSHILAEISPKFPFCTCLFCSSTDTPSYLGPALHPHGEECEHPIGQCSSYSVCSGCVCFRFRRSALLLGLWLIILTPFAENSATFWRGYGHVTSESSRRFFFSFFFFFSQLKNTKELFLWIRACFLEGKHCRSFFHWKEYIF